MNKLFSFGTYNFDVQEHEIVRESDKTFVVKDNFFKSDRTLRKDDMTNGGRIFATSMEELKVKKKEYIKHSIELLEDQKARAEKGIAELKKILEEDNED